MENREAAEILRCERGAVELDISNGDRSSSAQNYVKALSKALEALGVVKALEALEKALEKAVAAETKGDLSMEPSWLKDYINTPIGQAVYHYLEKKHRKEIETLQKKIVELNNGIEITKYRHSKEIEAYRDSMRR